MKRILAIINILLVMVMFASACGKTTSPALTSTLKPVENTATSAPKPTSTPEPVATVVPPADLLYVNITWHQHQPLYYKDTDGVYTRPWVRVHATKDYLDMAAMVAKYPNVHITFNLTPTLIRQLNDFVQNGAKDLYWVMAEKDSTTLTEDDKRFILQRFYDVNWTKIIARYPRYQELLDKRGGTDQAVIDAALASFSVQDFRDLQIWFNLAWFDPDYLAEEPLKALVEKGKDFSESDKTIVFDQVRSVMAQIIPLHSQLQQAGQIAVTTTPYAHPILPLLLDSNLAATGSPAADLPPQFSYPVDVAAQLAKSVEIYTENFGTAPVGLWPGEGSVAQGIVPFVAKAGYQWMQTGEPVLAKSLGIDSFSRNTSETVTQADALYRPYYVQDKSGNKVAVFFRDGTLSDKIGFTYSGVSGKAAAKDLINGLEAVRTELKAENAVGPHIVSIIVDGENAWENYPNDGKEFFHNLYQMLSESQTLKAVTPAEYLKMFSEQKKIDNLFPGAWFSPNYDTWIGETEENLAWEYLGKVRADLAKYDITKVRTASADAIAKAEDFMYLSEGSDWFWWYGDDQDSGQDGYFDQAFRALLAGVYQSLGEPVPGFVNVPIIQTKPLAATRMMQGMFTPAIDGKVSDKEWDAAAFYDAKGQSPAVGLSVGIDADNLYFRIDTSEALVATQRVGFYFAVPRSKDSYAFTRSAGEEPAVTLGFAATHLVEWEGGDTLKVYSPAEDGWKEQESAGKAAAGEQMIEFAVPLKGFGELEAGDALRLVAVLQPANQLLPSNGLVEVIVPDLGKSTKILEIQDPQGDDHGPGSYIYPTDTVFQKGVFDIKAFSVAYDDKYLIFKFTFYGAITNPWSSTLNFSLQTMDVYIDKDPSAGTGARLLLPGRNAALASGFGWDFAIWAEGWTPKVLAADAITQEPKELTAVTLKIVADPAARSVTVRVPRETFSDGDPAKWGYLAVVLSQEGYPSAGVWRVRDVNEKTEQWKIGGAPVDTNHTRIMDIAWLADSTPTQEVMLGTYPASTQDVKDLKPDDFAQLQMVVAK